MTRCPVDSKDVSEAFSLFKARESKLLEDYASEQFSLPNKPLPESYNPIFLYNFSYIEEQLDNIEKKLKLLKTEKLVDAALAGNNAEVTRLLQSGVKVTDKLPADTKYKPEDPAKRPYGNAFCCYLNKKNAQVRALEKVNVKQGYNPTPDVVDHTRSLAGGLTTDFTMYAAYAIESLWNGKRDKALKAAEKIQLILDVFRQHGVPLPNTTELQKAFIRYANAETLLASFNYLEYESKNFLSTSTEGVDVFYLLRDYQKAMIVTLLSSPFSPNEINPTLAERYQAHCDNVIDALMDKLVVQLNVMKAESARRSLAIDHLIERLNQIKNEGSGPDGTDSKTPSEKIFSMLEEMVKTHNGIRNSFGGSLGWFFGNGSTTADYLERVINDAAHQMGVPNCVKKENHQLTVSEPSLPDKKAYMGEFKKDDFVMVDKPIQ